MTADSLKPSAAQGETFRHDEPIYAQLASAWRAAGRAVPGQPDHEWRRLTGGVPRHPVPLPRYGGVLLPGKHRRDAGGQPS